jgi:PTH2 family peptidyl-tRNA hydrolase
MMGGLGRADKFEGWLLEECPYIREWLGVGGFKKICLQVETEEELDEIYNKALAKGIHCAMIIDSGKTEFKGVPTKTCCAIGPWNEEEIDEITGHLDLL